jgi:predicted RNA binding protein YcfA (HicA-like mRNA interferase family)
MPKLLSSQEIIKVLEDNSFDFISQKGSHLKYFSSFYKKTVIVPANKKVIPAGTFASILRQSGLTRKDFGL